MFLPLIAHRVLFILSRRPPGPLPPAAAGRVHSWRAERHVYYIIQIIKYSVSDTSKDGQTNVTNEYKVPENRDEDAKRERAPRVHFMCIHAMSAHNVLGTIRTYK